jgi:hypothetical protein
MKGIIMEPKDLFKFVEDNQDEIGTLTQAFGDFLRQRQPDPYVVLASLTDVVAFIIEHNFIAVDNAEHLRLLTNQTLEAYRNAILGTAEPIMRGRFNETLRDGEDDEIYTSPFGRS